MSCILLYLLIITKAVYCLYENDCSTNISEHSSSHSDIYNEWQNPHQYIQLVQNLLFQSSINVGKGTKQHTDELRIALFRALTSINDSKLHSIMKTLQKVEDDMVRTFTSLSEELLLDTDSLLTNTNIELQNSVDLIIKDANKKIVEGFNNIVIFQLKPKDPKQIDLKKAIKLINLNFGELLTALMRIFEQTTLIERTNLNKIFRKNRNLQLIASTNLIRRFESKLCCYFKDLDSESVGLIGAIICEKTHKFITNIEYLFHKVAEDTMAVFKSCLNKIN
ncbi:hypothetical protein NGRA_2194 [Nosema granulosis]|uniref:Uncharacterized protein n=1 Tax=Nosema granulosis TaxID=83296 RepID=A0A9P6GY34_9MICR|nr:hypothetical protein NGRA_2194 [Nosema granulosis]